MKYAFFNSGSVYFFEPYKTVYDIRFENSRQTALDFHIKLVKERNDPSVYILDNHGNVVDVNSKQRFKR